VICRDNRAIIGGDPNRVAPGQIPHIPRTDTAVPSRGWALPWLIAVPGSFVGIVARRRWRSRSGRAAKSDRPGSSG
jgi:hypothetical protein